MLKLMRFPRAANRNRTLKQRQGEALQVEEDSVREVARVCRRFWRERAAARSRFAGWPTPEEMGCVQ